MKVRNLELKADRTFRYRALELDRQAGMTTFVHHGDQEAILAEKEGVVFNPKAESFDSLEELLQTPDPEVIEPRKVGYAGRLFGDSPFLLLSSAGIPFYQQRKAGPRPYKEVGQRYALTHQAAFHNKAVNAAIRDQNASLSLGLTVVFAGICALAAILAAIAVIPELMERF